MATAADWERPLRALVAGTTRSGSTQGDEADIGLQFELVLPQTPLPASTGHRPPARHARRPTTPTAGIKIRPVVPSRSGNWVRTGISWTNLDYYAYGRHRSPATAARLALVKELLALSRLTGPTYTYSYANIDVWLQTITSRRVWDLLRQAHDVGLPLLGTGRRAAAVTVHPGAAATLDVTRTDTGLLLQPSVDAGGQPIPLHCSIPIGTPTHGLAWWDPDTSASPHADTPPLHLAQLTTPFDDTLRSFVKRGPVTVPEDAEDRFFEAFYPEIRRRVVVQSSDQSVDLPQTPPPILVLTVTHGVNHHVAVQWSIGRAGRPGRQLLDDDTIDPDDREAVDTLTAAAVSVLLPLSSLVQPTPTGPTLAPTADLYAMAAVQFVAELLPQLADIPGIDVEQHGVVPDYRQATEAPVVTLSGSETTDTDWFDLTVEITVGDEHVPFEQLFVALAQDQTHLVLPSGTYFPLDRPELRQLAELIAEARSLHDAPGGTVRLSRFQASLWDDLCRLGVVTAQASMWEASVRALAEATDRVDHPVPSGIDATLRPYQQVGFNWLAFLYEHDLGGVLADDMGLGKTLQALALICHVKEEGLAKTPFLVVAPTSVVANWTAECRRFAPDLVAVAVTETGKRRGIPLDVVAGPADIVVTSYALLRLEYDDYEAIEWAGLFLDEAQFVKNRHAKTYQQVKKLPVPYKIAMTGTPFENNLMELWTLLSLTAPGLFADPDRFTRDYQVPIERHGDTERLDRLRRRIRPLLLRRTKEHVAAELPAKQEQILALDLNPKQKKLYQTYLARERQKVLGLLGDMNKNRFEIFRSLMVLRQGAIAMSLIDTKHANVPSTKLDAVDIMLHDIVEDGHRVLVFSQFTRFLGQVRQRMVASGIDHCYLDGRTRKRAEVIERFRAGHVPVFLISLKAGGFGLNLTEADYCIILDPWWNPATEAQAVDRTHRIGQTKNVMVYRLVANDTIEEKVMALKARKQALFANVVDSGSFESGALTAADISELVS